MSRDSVPLVLAAARRPVGTLRLSLGMVMFLILPGCQNDSLPAGLLGSADAAVVPVPPTALAGLCSDPRADAGSLPLDKQSLNGLFRVKLTDWQPSRPQLGLNSWTLQVTDAKNQAATGLDWIVRPFMPDHGHGTSPPSVAAYSVPGSYQITDLNLFMAGVWQIQIILTSQQAISDRVTFTFCLRDTE